MFTDFGQVSYLLNLGKAVGRENNLTNNSRTAHGIRHKSFSMVQSVGIKNWVPQLINRLQNFILLCHSVTHFFDLYDKKNVHDKDKDKKF